MTREMEILKEKIEKREKEWDKIWNELKNDCKRYQESETARDMCIEISEILDLIPEAIAEAKET